jgi:hypothetical protein
MSNRSPLNRPNNTRRTWYSSETSFDLIRDTTPDFIALTELTKSCRHYLSATLLVVGGHMLPDGPLAAYPTRLEFRNIIYHVRLYNRTGAGTRNITAKPATSMYQSPVSISARGLSFQHRKDFR